MSKPMYRDFDPSADAEALHLALYEGAIVRFRDLAPMRELVAFTRDFLERRFAPHPPVETHRHCEEQALADAYSAAQREFSNLPEAKRLWTAVFEAAGLDPEETARDRLILRFQPPHPPDRMRPWARSTATVSFHRDTWGTNLYAQVNWWAPVYPIDETRTFAFFPDLFDRPLANSSSDFDLDEVMRRGREGPQAVGPGEMVPRLLEPVAIEDGLPVTIAPGEIIAFSAQHAHAGIQNHGDLTRISLETRTLRIPDQLCGRGARNVDGRARWMAPGMFRRLSDGKRLSDVLGIAPLQPFPDPLPAARETGAGGPAAT